MVRVNFNLDKIKHSKFKTKAFSEGKTIAEILTKFVDSYIGKGEIAPEENKLEPKVEVTKSHSEGDIKVIDEAKLEEVSVISEKAENSVKTIPRAKHSNKKPYPTFFKKV